MAGVPIKGDHEPTLSDPELLESPIRALFRLMAGNKRCNRFVGDHRSGHKTARARNADRTYGYPLSAT